MAVNPYVDILNVRMNDFDAFIIAVISAIIVEAIAFITSVGPIFNGVSAAVVQRPHHPISKPTHFLPSNVK